MIFLSICLIVVSLCLIVMTIRSQRKLKTLAVETEDAQDLLRKQLDADILQKQEQIEWLNTDITNLCTQINEYKEAICQLDSLKNEHLSEIEKLSIQNINLQAEIDATNSELATAQEQLDGIQSKYLAYIQERERRAKMDTEQDYYKLTITPSDVSDISLLREIQLRFSKKESIDKLIWEVYIKPAYDALTSRICNPSKKICGIYKITCLTTGAEYIGQSVDIRERFRQHIKTALAFGNKTNKLYQAMQEFGVNNFTFEVLEEVAREKLNERETYWINFYKTKEYGLNGTIGVKNS